MKAATYLIICNNKSNKTKYFRICHNRYRNIPVTGADVYIHHEALNISRIDASDETRKVVDMYFRHQMCMQMQMQCSNNTLEECLKTSLRMLEVRLKDVLMFL